MAFQMTSMLPTSQELATRSTTRPSGRLSTFRLLSLICTAIILLTALHDLGAAILQIMYAIHDYPSSTPSAIWLRPDVSTCGRPAVIDHGCVASTIVDAKRFFNHFKKFAQWANFFLMLSCGGLGGQSRPQESPNSF